MKKTQVSASHMYDKCSETGKMNLIQPRVQSACSEPGSGETRGPHLQLRKRFSLNLRFDLEGLANERSDASRKLMHRWEGKSNHVRVHVLNLNPESPGPQTLMHVALGSFTKKP